MVKLSVAAFSLVVFACNAAILPDVPNESIEVVKWHSTRRYPSYPKLVRIKASNVTIQGVPCMQGTEAHFDQSGRLLDAFISKPVDFEALHCDVGYKYHRRFRVDGSVAITCVGANQPDPDMMPDAE